MKDTEKQQLVMEMQVLHQEIQQLNEHMQHVQEQLQELVLTEETIKELPDLKKDNDVLIPLASGIFARARITDTDHAVINAGSQVFVEKDLKATQGLIDEQKKKLEEYMMQLTVKTQQMHGRFHELQHTLSSE